MKSRLFVVDSNSLAQAINSNTASILFDIDFKKAKQWEKTLADVMADMLQIEIGDYIFFWEKKEGGQKSRIHGVYRVVSKPYYEVTSPNDKAPFKVKIEKAYSFNNSLDEYEFLNCPYIRDNQWTVIGKKVAGKPRGTTPLSMQESKELITMLIGINPDYSFIPWDDKRIIKIKKPLSFSYLNKGKNTVPDSLLTLNPNEINFLNSKGDVHFEKDLETFFNKELTDRNSSFFSQLGIDVSKVKWYSNYLPYSIERSEIDYLIMESDDGENISRIVVIEFMKTSLDNDHIARCLIYSRWVNETLALGAPIVEPIIICKKSNDYISGPKKLKLRERIEFSQKYIADAERINKTKPLSVFCYDFSGETPIFIKKR